MCEYVTRNSFGYAGSSSPGGRGERGETEGGRQAIALLVSTLMEVKGTRGYHHRPDRSACKMLVALPEMKFADRPPCAFSFAFAHVLEK